MRRVAGVGAALLTGVTLAVVPAGTARAYDSAQPGIVSENPADWTPNVTSSGAVHALAQVGNTIVAGGRFSEVESARGDTPLARNNLFSFDATNGAISSTFPPDVDGLVREVVASPADGAVFIGGDFKHVDGASRVSLAKVRLSDGMVMPGFTVPRLDGRVFSLNLANGKLYVAGTFTHVAGRSLARITALDPTTGAIDSSFTVDFAGTNNPDNPGITQIIKTDVSPDGSRMVVIGNFATVNGLDRPQIVQLDLTTTPPSVVDWRTSRYRAPCSPSFQTYMRDVAFSPDGRYFAVVTTGGGGTNPAGGCDATARWETDGTGTDVPPTWISFTGNDTLLSVAITGTAVYTGGHNRWQNNPYGHDSQGPGGVPRPGLSALDPLTGVPFRWNPGRTTGVGVFDLLATPAGLWIGDDTSEVGAERHDRLAFFPLTGGTSVPSVDTGALPGYVLRFGDSGATAKAQGSCGTTSSPSAADVAITRHLDPSAAPPAGPVHTVTSASRAWDDMHGAFVLSGRLYTGWADGTFCAGPVDGTTIGELSPLELYNNKFAAELPTVTGMFFLENRIYYSRDKMHELYSRAYVPESEILGATSVVASPNVSGIDFSRVRAMFLAGSTLYFGTRDDADLHAIDWAAGAPVAGTERIVSGQGVDGASWTGAALSSYTPSTRIDDSQPPEPPTASFTVSCAGLTCHVDGRGSSDNDGSVDSYAWDFGDGAAATGSTADHTYSDSGAFEIALTVTDSDGLDDTATKSVDVTAPAAPTTFVGSSATNQNGRSWAVQIPDTVEAGDGLLLIAAVNSAKVSLSGPGDGSGWALLDDAAVRSTHTTVWQRTSAAGDAGRTVTLTASTWLKADVVLLAYRGEQPTVPVLTHRVTTETANSSDHTTPVLTAPSPGGRWVVSIWTDKSSSTSSLTAPEGQRVRHSDCGTGGGHMCVLVSDAAGPPGSATPVGGLTANADASSTAATMWTLVLGA